MDFAPVEYAPPPGSLFGASGHQRTMHNLRAEAHHDPPVSQHQLRAENAARAERIAAPSNSADAEALAQVEAALIDYWHSIWKQGPRYATFQADDFHRWADQCKRMPIDFDRRKTAGLLKTARDCGHIVAVGAKLTKGNPERGSNSSYKAVYELRTIPNQHGCLL